MSLPKVETPIFETTVPSTGEKVKFRPFLVKEEKILMLASESEEFKDMITACGQIIENCTFDKLDATKLAMFDMQDLFIRIREASIGSTQEFNLICGECKKSTKYEMELKDLTVKGLDSLPDNEVKVGEEFIIKMRYPRALDVVAEDKQSDIDTIANCIESIITEEEEVCIYDVTKEELQEFVENLPVESFGEMREYLRAIPILTHNIDFTCPHCGAEQIININGYEHFFA